MGGERESHLHLPTLEQLYTRQLYNSFIAKNLLYTSIALRCGRVRSALTGRCAWASGEL
jgi:hypothetical protein